MHVCQRHHSKICLINSENYCVWVCVWVCMCVCGWVDVCGCACVCGWMCVYLNSVPKSDRTTVHKNLIVALGVAELLLMCSDWVSANEVRLNIWHICTCFFLFFVFYKS